MKMPSLSIFFEGAGEKIVNLGCWEATHIKTGLDEPHVLAISRSFCTLSIVVDGCALEAAHLIVDGSPNPLRSLGGVLVTRIQLNNDVEIHRIAFVKVPDIACTVDLTVVHQYQVALGGIQQAVAKWSAIDFDREFDRFKPIIAKQRQIARDASSNSFRFGTTAELNSALLQAIGTLIHLLGSLRPPELLVDFASLRAGDIDLSAILTYLKQDPRRLLKDAEGSIEIAGERFTTDVNERLLSRSSRVELVPAATIIEHCSELLKRTSAPAAASILLRYAANDVRDRFSVRGFANERDIDLLLSRRMHSSIGSQLQAQLRLLLACATEIVGRDNKADGLLWLRQSVRDFDLFQSSCFYALARAFGFSHEEAMSPAGVLKRDGITVMNGNRGGALQEFFALSNGWRRDSKQPSEYRPDLVVLLAGIPVVLDAKFAIANSETLPLPSAPLKEVQAYLDEFGLPGAVLIVPKVLDAAHLEAEGYVEITGNDKTGRQRLLLGVPLADSHSTDAHSALRKAVERIAKLP